MKRINVQTDVQKKVAEQHTTSRLQNENHFSQFVMNLHSHTGKIHIVIHYE